MQNGHPIQIVWVVNHVQHLRQVTIHLSVNGSKRELQQKTGFAFKSEPLLERGCIGYIVD